MVCAITLSELAMRNIVAASGFIFIWRMESVLFRALGTLRPATRLSCSASKHSSE
jgi:hypothetical protein